MCDVISCYIKGKGKDIGEYQITHWITIEWRKKRIIDDMSFTCHMLKKVELGPPFVLHGNAQALFILMNSDMSNVSNRLCLRTSGSNLTVDGWFVHCGQQWHVSWV